MLRSGTTNENTTQRSTKESPAFADSDANRYGPERCDVTRKDLANGKRGT